MKSVSGYSIPTEGPITAVDVLMDVCVRGGASARTHSALEKHRTSEIQHMEEKESNRVCRTEWMTMRLMDQSLYFIHTDMLGKLLMQGVSINAPCNEHTDCQGHCKMALATFIQNKVGRDVGTIVGAYLVGKGYPGDVYVALGGDLHYISHDRQPIVLTDAR